MSSLPSPTTLSALTVTVAGLEVSVTPDPSAPSGAIINGVCTPGGEDITDSLDALFDEAAWLRLRRIVAERIAGA